jgi:hypothetical protein
LECQEVSGTGARPDIPKFGAFQIARKFGGQLRRQAKFMRTSFILRRLDPISNYLLDTTTINMIDWCR